MEKVTVEFKFQNILSKSENKQGILLPGNVVFVENEEGMGLYRATLVQPSVYHVDLDDPNCTVENVSVIDLIAESIEGMRAS